MDQQNPQYSLFFGPSVSAPYAAATVEFTPAFPQVLDPQVLQRLLGELLPATISLNIEWPVMPLDTGALVALLANAFQDLRGPNQLPHASTALGGGRVRVTVGFHDSEAAMQALRSSVALANAVYARAGGAGIDHKGLSGMLAHCAAIMAAYQPDFVARALMAAAARRGIPVLPLVSGSRAWVYGEGVHAFHFVEASTHRDSKIGMHLARNKLWTSKILKSLGLPAAEHQSAASPEQAVSIARRIGYPVVVKPVLGSKGKGISIGVRDDAALVAAFGRARGTGTEPVLVERFIAGDDYRLSVFGGHLLRASRLVPPQVIGDGSTSLALLIDAENRSRSDADVAATHLVRLAIDADMLALIRDQGFGPGDVPPKGTRIILRRNSNLASGGRLEDVTDMLHPDNRTMAEAIARALHLDAVGIDFMSADPTRSWHEGNAAVIEINATPGVGPVLAERIIAQKFQGNGRIPAVLVPGDSGETAINLSALLEKAGLCVGRTGPDGTWIGGHARFMTTATLPVRIRALLLDPACAALVVCATAEELLESGLPHARFGLAVIPDKSADSGMLPQQIDALLTAHVETVVRGKITSAKLAAAVKKLLAAREPA